MNSFTKSACIKGHINNDIMVSGISEDKNTLEYTHPDYTSYGNGLYTVNIMTISSGVPNKKSLLIGKMDWTFYSHWGPSGYSGAVIYPDEIEVKINTLGEINAIIPYQKYGRNIGFAFTGNQSFEFNWTYQ